MVGRFKATFKQSTKWKDKFYNTICALPISVGQMYHEGDKFAATISLIEKYFAKCVILLCDSLQRYSIMINDNCDENVAYKKSILEGNLWLIRNKNKFSNINIPLKIYRWDQWYKSKDYLYYYNFIENFRKNNSVFNDAINYCAKKFIDAKMRFLNKDFSLAKYDININLCREYLKEESTVLLMWHKEHIDFEAYPSKNNMVLDSLYKNLLCENDQFGNLIPLNIKFKKRLRECNDDKGK